MNFPAVSMARCEGQRIIFSNENVPKVLGNVLSVLADNNVNVIDMMNRSRGDLAYNILDIERTTFDNIAQEIAKIEHVKLVRLIG